MARKAKAVLEKKSSTLLDALKFCSLAQSDKGTPYQTHCILNGKTVMTFDGTLAAGKMIDEEFSLICPQSAKLIAALEKCSGNYAIVNDQSTLKLKTEKLEVFIPCLPWDVMQFITPDAAQYPLNDAVYKGFAIVLPVAENGTGIFASILLRSGSILATDRSLMLEFWHGLELPPLPLPKIAVAAILKASKPLAWLGVSEGSATFWFDDGSWLKTLLHAERWPDVAPILDRPANAWPVPSDFFNGVRAVVAHSEGFVHLGKNLISSHSIETANVGASYQCDGVTSGPIFNAKKLLSIEPLTKTIDFIGSNNVSLFFGENLRGAIVQAMPAREPELPKPRQPMTPEEQSAHEAYMAEVRKRQYNDDIPF